MEATGRSASHSLSGNGWILAEQQIDMEGTTMRRRSRRNKPINMLGAFLVEVGAMLVIVALAQPTWTRNLIEQISPASLTSVSSAPADPVISNAEVFPAAVASATQASEPSRAMQTSSETSERLAMAGWSAQSMPANEYAAAPQYSQYSDSVDPYASHQYYSNGPQLKPRSAIRPIYPPPASIQPMPAWSNSY